MEHRSADRDFAGYNAAQAGRPVRALAVSAVAAAGPVRGARSVNDPEAAPLAVELGCGRGIEARFLAENGYTVRTYDADPSVAPLMAEMTAELPVEHRTADLAKITELPGTDLILACATLPFVPRTAFAGLWSTMLQALRPGGILAVDLFGDRDGWAWTDGTFLRRAEVETLLEGKGLDGEEAPYGVEGLEVLTFSEVEREGSSFAGPKHWHGYQILAGRP